MTKNKNHSTKTYTYEGWLALHHSGDSSDLLYITSVKYPLAEEIKNLLGWRKTQVSVRYIVSNKALSENERLDVEILQSIGEGKAEFGAHYNELTGYLYTDEEFKIGGHDLIVELKSSIGKWLWLEIQIHNSN